MTRFYILLALFISTPFPVNAQNGSSLLSIENDAPVETPPHEAKKDIVISFTDGCRSGGANGLESGEELSPQVLFRLENVLLREGICQVSPLVSTIDSEKSRISTSHLPPPTNLVGQQEQAVSAPANGHTGFKWAPALKQYLLFLAVEHGFDLTQDKTRREIKGPFIKDYFRSVVGLGGWDDGGKFFTNYIAHPMEGAVYGFIQIQNDRKGMKQEFSRSKGYWISRLKAMGWTAMCSTQFELGPLSQASIGNVGLHTAHSGKTKRKMAYVDLVITPVLGTGWIVGEDVIDRYALRSIENMDNVFLRNTIRVLLNPMRSSTNLLRFKKPWYRDN